MRSGNVRKLDRCFDALAKPERSRQKEDVKMEEKIMVTGVKGMYCRQCPELILGDVLQTRGVLDASVAYLKGVLTVKFDPGIVSEDEIRRVLENGGYPACPIGAPGTNPLLNALKSPFTRKK